MSFDVKLRVHNIIKMYSIDKDSYLYHEILIFIKFLLHTVTIISSETVEDSPCT
jgi:hypothetical protein